MGTVYAFVTPAGLPYDEPSHWATVQYYAGHSRMPVLGDRGVTYEAQMGPVAYAADAAIVRISERLGFGSETAFRVVRLFGVLQLAALVVVIGALLTRVVAVLDAAFVALAVLALNPMLLTMSASVQNDSLALLLGVLVLYLALEHLSDRPRTGTALALGCLAGVGVLTKLTDWVVVAVAAAWLVWRHRREAVVPVAAFLGGAVAVSGWWFARNLALYGDPTSASAVRRTGVSFERYHVSHPSDLGHVVQQVVTYLWLPTEYLRNFISASSPLKAILLIVTIGILILGGSRLGSTDHVGLTLLAGTAVLSLTVWLGTYLAYQSVAPRVAYLGLPLWALVLIQATVRIPRPLQIPTVLALMVVINLLTLAEVRDLDAPVFLHF